MFNPHPLKNNDSSLCITSTFFGTRKDSLLALEESPYMRSFYRAHLANKFIGVYYSIHEYFYLLKISRKIATDNLSIILVSWYELALLSLLETLFPLRLLFSLKHKVFAAIKEVDTIYVFDWYSKTRSFMASFRKPNSLYIDVQHGLINKSHFAYNPSHPLHSRLRSFHKPDGFMVRSEFEAQFLKKAFPKKTVFVTPPPNQSFLQILPSLHLDRVTCTSTLRILLTLGYTFPGSDLYPKDHLKTGKFSSDLMACMKHFSEYDICWMVRLHPYNLSKFPLYAQFLQSYLRLFINKKCHVVSPSYSCLEACLRSTDLHITVNSSVSIHALSQEIPTLFIKSYTDLLDDVYIRGFRTQIPEHLINIANNFYEMVTSVKTALANKQYNSDTHITTLKY